MADIYYMVYFVHSAHKYTPNTVKTAGPEYLLTQPSELFCFLL